MLTLIDRNVNGLFHQGMQMLASKGERGESRAGPVVTYPSPVMSVYKKPCERVLLCPVRNANPFFHLFEGLWMLAGRNDAASLNRYVSDFGDRFGEPDGTIHDAYGYRWRHALGFDQLNEIVQRLRTNMGDRQCVLQMWDVTDTGKFCGGANDLCGDWRGRPCNTHIYFRARKFRDTNNADNCVSDNYVLDMTVCCRSNDVVWGAYGANAVHFSMLMEYMAGRVGVGVGTMYQLSNNYHGYVDALDKLGSPDDLSTEDPYVRWNMPPVPMAMDWNSWDEDLRIFMDWHDDYIDLESPLDSLDDRITNKWFHDVAGRMSYAHWLWKNKETNGALLIANQIEAADWRSAVMEWMQRIVDKRTGVGDVR